jgi:hypothetical protein
MFDRYACLTAFLVVALMIAPGWSQEASEQRAVIVAGGRPNQGGCTVEVLVTGSAEIEIHADRAALRGPVARAAQWRRFECTGILPKNPFDFRFAHAAGRGHPKLIRDPRVDGGVPAIIRIQNPGLGPKDYIFTITWTAYGDTARSWRPRS